jgi:tRNA pseudouridine32 synthase / 23S rRNA pseudouridine746 synthase
MAASVFIGGLSNGPPGERLALLHADPHLVVADKPAGLLCVPGRGAGKEDCLAARVQERFADALVVHRLDMATSGICLFARGMAMQRALGIAFASRDVDKRYVAVVAGEPSSMAAQGEIDLPLRADWPNRPRQCVDAEAGKPSLTRWRVLGPGPQPGSTRLELEPVTGRTHQLRVHLQAAGHPILGDTLYAPDAVAHAAPRLLLHAAELGLVHPATGERMLWRSAVPF